MFGEFNAETMIWTFVKPNDETFDDESSYEFKVG
jgi:hypothetical protein